MTRARATVILVGESEGVWWEIETALRHARKVPLALIFPIGLPRSPTLMGFYRRDDVPAPRMPPAVIARLRKVFANEDLGPLPEPKRCDHVLVIDGPGPTRFLRTKMSLTYYALAINPVTVVFWLLCRAFPAIPWRQSLDGEISYQRTLTPFVREGQHS